MTRERLPWQVLAGVGIGFAGVAVLAQPSGGAKWWGIALCFCSAVMWATGSFLSARIEMPTDPFAATSLEMLAGGFVMLPISLFTVHGLSPSAGSIAGWIYLVVVRLGHRLHRLRRGCSRTRRSGWCRRTRT